MKSLRSATIALAVLVVLVFAASPAGFAQMGMMGGPHSPSAQERPSPRYSAEPFSLESFKERLGLTDEQAGKFEKLWSDYRKETIRKGADIQVDGIELSELLDQKKVDLAQVEKKLRQLESVKTELALYRIKTLFKTKEFLSEDQFEKLKSQSLRMMQHEMNMAGREGSKMMCSHKMCSGMMGQGMMGHHDMDSSEEEEEE